MKFIKDIYNRYIILILHIPLLVFLIPILIYLDDLILGISLFLLGFSYYRFLIFVVIDMNIIGFIFGLQTIGLMFAGIFIILKYLFSLLV